MSGPRSTLAWQRVRAQVIAEESACWICGRTEFVSKRCHPHSRSVDHIRALAVGGPLLDRRNLRLACFGCNSSRGVGSSMPLAPRSEQW
jgi:5-methylcytosine-specific restriction endonuclease McrA